MPFYNWEACSHVLKVYQGQDAFQAAEKIGIVEETKLEPTFEEGIKKVEAYRLAVDSALDGLEAMVQVTFTVQSTVLKLSCAFFEGVQQQRRLQHP